MKRPGCEAPRLVHRGTAALGRKDADIMQRRHIIALSAFTVLTVFLLLVGWEFVLEDAVDQFVGGEHEPESNGQRWEFVLLGTTATSIAVLISTFVSARVVRERGRAEDAHRRTEARFSDVLEIASEAIISTDEEGRIQLFNQGAERIFGYPAAEIIGRPLDLLIPARFRDMHSGQMAAFRAAPESNRLMDGRGTIWGLRKDGTEFPAEAAISKLAAGGRLAFNVLLHDITERKRAEDALRESERAAQERLAQLEEAHRRLEWQGGDLVQLAGDLRIARDEAEAANRAKSEFLALMSHELRTPLNAVIGFSEIIKEETFGPVGSAQYREYADDIHASGQHLLALINDILDLSKVESGANEVHEEDISVPTAVEAVVRLVKDRAHRGGIRLATSFSPAIPDLRADQRKLKQILINLLSNAVKFTESGGEVALRCWCDQDGGLSFQVSDTGVGIAPEDIATAMAPFQQVDSQLSRKYEGTGLGLPLTKALVELQGGTLDIESEVGTGTTVTVRFPVARTVRVSAGGAPPRPGEARKDFG
jgi:PAS domain S-box-containing protein